MQSFKNILVYGGTEQPDLLAMGIVCRTGIAGFYIGNTAESLIPDALCSVLALKTDELVSPVEMSGILLTEENESLPLIGVSE